MPKDKSGKHHPNLQRAHAADRTAKKHIGPPAGFGGAPMGAESPSHKITDHGDGTFSSEHPDGEMADHGSADEMIAHLQQKIGGSKPSIPHQSPMEPAGKSLHGMY